MGVGVVVRDNSGSVLAALATVVSFTIDPSVVEIVAVWKAINFYSNLCFNKVIF
jgi:hypothetical protein